MLVLALGCWPDAWQPADSTAFGIFPSNAMERAMETTRALHYEVLLPTERYERSYGKLLRWGYAGSFVAVPSSRPPGKYAYVYAVSLVVQAISRRTSLEVRPLVY